MLAGDWQSPEKQQTDPAQEPRPSQVMRHEVALQRTAPWHDCGPEQRSVPIRLSVAMPAAHEPRPEHSIVHWSPLQ